VIHFKLQQTITPSCVLEAIKHFLMFELSALLAHCCRRSLLIVTSTGRARSQTWGLFIFTPNHICNHHRIKQRRRRRRGSRTKKMLVAAKKCVAKF
jgi:hypothetical protein